MKKTLTLMCLTQLCLSAQGPSMLRDITPGSASTQFGEFKTLANQNLVFMTGGTVATSAGLWTTDGSAAGTVQLKQLSQMSNLGELQGHVYAAGTNSNGVKAIWKTNGSVLGTDSVVLPTSLQSVTGLMANNSAVMFVATTGSGKELWRTDGSAPGTYSLMALDDIKTFTVISNILYFKGVTTSGGTELYRTDGTVSGTFLLRDVWSGAGSSFTTNSPILGAQGGKIYLVLNDGVSGNELWTTDGTTAGTSLVKDIFPGTGSSNININYFFIANNGVYFNASNPATGQEPWFSDGTTANTVMIRDVAPGAGGSNPNNLRFVNNNAYFLHAGIMYKSDGTAAGTSTLDVRKQYSTSNQDYSFDNRLHLYNNELYFVTVRPDPNSGSPVHDTIILSKVDLGLTSRSVVAKLDHFLISAGSTIFDQLLMGTTMIGPRLMFFFRTQSPKVSIAIFNLSTGNHKLHYQMGDGDPMKFTHPYDYAALGNKFYLPHTKNGITPGYIDLTNDSIYPLNNGSVGYGCGGPPGFWRHDPYHLNNKSYFLASESGYGLEWYVTDYTTAGTFRVKDINPGSGNFDNNTSQNNCSFGEFSIIPTANNLYFLADDGGNGLELWSMLTTTGTPVAIASSAQLTQVRLFPNPARDVVNIQSPVPVRLVAVYNLVGARVREQTLNGSTEIFLNGLASGVYLLEVATASSTEVFRIIKE